MGPARWRVRIHVGVIAPVADFVEQLDKLACRVLLVGIDKTTGGTVLGAVGGAVAGAQFGQGLGKIAAAALGTLLGAFVGHEVGQSLDRADTAAAQQAVQRAYVAPGGQTITWDSPGTGHSGTVTPTREGRDAQNNTCREFKQTVAIDGKQTEVTSTACRKADGGWGVIGN